MSPADLKALRGVPGCGKVEDFGWTFDVRHERAVAWIAKPCDVCLSLLVEAAIARRDEATAKWIVEITPEMDATQSEFERQVGERAIRQAVERLPEYGNDWTPDWARVPDSRGRWAPVLRRELLAALLPTPPTPEGPSDRG